MDRSISLYLLATLMLVALHPKADSQWVSHHPLPPADLPPLCASQFALANRACSRLPYTPVPPPSPPSPPSPPVESHHHHHNRRHHHGHKHHRHKETLAEEDCCRWLKEVDDICICGLLVHLPPFLARPAHNYTVLVDESCQVTFACASRVVPFTTSLIP